MTKPEKIQEALDAIKQLDPDRGGELVGLAKEKLGGGYLSMPLLVAIATAMRQLVLDRHWEPARSGFTTDEECEQLHSFEAGCPVIETAIDESLKLYGDRLAASLTYHEILADAQHWWGMELRNLVRDFMIEQKLIPEIDPVDA